MNVQQVKDMGRNALKHIPSETSEFRVNATENGATIKIKYKDEENNETTITTEITDETTSVEL